MTPTHGYIVGYNRWFSVAARRHQDLVQFLQL